MGSIMTSKECDNSFKVKKLITWASAKIKTSFDITHNAINRVYV